MADVGNIVQFAVNFQQTDAVATGRIILNYRIAALNIQNSLQGFVDAIWPQWISDWEEVRDSSLGVSHLYNPEFTIGGVTCFNINVPTESAVNTTQSTGKGGVGLHAYNPRAAVLASHITGLRGRSYRGRTYFPPITEDYIQSGGTLTETAGTIWASFLNDIRSIQASAQEAQLVVYSETLSNPPTSVVATPVTSIALRNALGSQRRRRRVLA